MENKLAQFKVGDYVKIVRCLDSSTLPIGNYLSNNTYVHEEELELDIPETVLNRM